MIRKKQILTIFFIVALIISNVVANRLLVFGELVIAGGFVCYGITFLVTDIVGELYGKKEATKLVVYGFIAQLFASFLLLLTGFLPALDKNYDSAYILLFQSNIIITIASLTAYITSQIIDVYIFHKIKNMCNDKYKWIRNNVSTILSQFVDTFVFIFIGFGLGQGLLFENLNLLFSLILGQYLAKILVAICDTPFFYLFTRKTSRNKQL